MLQVAIHGAAGRMGQSIASVLAHDAEAKLVAAMDREGCESLGRDIGTLTAGAPSGVCITSDVEEFLSNVEVVIDFSTPSATAKLLPLCAGQHIPMVVGTTGLDANARAGLERAAERVAVVFAPNFSQGVNALYFLAARAAELLGPTFDAEILEIHHRNKVDAPSGTAVRLTETVAAAKQLDPVQAVTHGRTGAVGARPLEEIGVLALRGGDVVGEHTLYLVGEGERIELTHRATDRSIFARGAVRAAHWVIGRPAGLYDMADVMGIPR
ncbi:MAG: 4-hydroxy-tetrahydrodipicolinate reductase [Myxococcales bacterium]|nr:4-hydroxy-tetrahydrodipicolinate reductase [Myxococcales bacterium]